MMTKKQRFLAAVRGEMPDMVPVAPLIHHRYAHKVLGRSDWRAVFEVHQLIGSIHHRGPISVGASCAPLPDGYGHETRKLERRADGTVVSEIVIRTPKRTMTGKHLSGMIPGDPLVGKTVEYPVKSVEDWQAYLDYRQQTLARLTEPALDHIRQVVDVMGEEGMPSVGIGSPYAALGAARGMQDLMTDLFDLPDLMNELFELERCIMEKNVQAFCDAPTDVAWLDVCWATGSVLGPDTFEKWALPDIVRAMNVVRRTPGKVLGLYTLGRIRDLMPMFADAGVDFVETFEPNEGNITLADAKKLYGDRMCLMGNFDCLVLARGTVADARREARRCLREGMAGGGYVMVSADEVPADAKMDNLKAMVETVEQHGVY